MKTIIQQASPPVRRFVEFGINDAKGRAIGVIISTTPLKATEAPQDWEGGFYQHLECGEYVGISIIAARNGEGFGACQPRQLFKTQAEADAAIAKRIKSTRARYAKQFPQV